MRHRGPQSVEMPPHTGRYGVSGAVVTKREFHPGVTIPYETLERHRRQREHQRHVRRRRRLMFLGCMVLTACLLVVGLSGLVASWVGVLTYRGSELKPASRSVAAPRLTEASDLEAAVSMPSPPSRWSALPVLLDDPVYSKGLWRHVTLVDGITQWDNQPVLLDPQQGIWAGVPQGWLPSLLPVVAPRVDEQLAEAIRNLLRTTDMSLTPHVYYYSFDDGSEVSIGGDQPVAAASVIKLPLLYQFALLQDQLEPSHQPWQVFFPQHLRASGSGSWNFLPANQWLPAQQALQDMIQLSDNTCTNIVVQALGGVAQVNRYLKAQGLSYTRLVEPLPDLDGLNRMTPREMATVMAHVVTGTGLSPARREVVMGILAGVRNRSLIPALLPGDVSVYHKTGDIGTALGDTAYVVLPSGRRYLLSVQVERPFNAPQARPLVQQLSRLVYDHQVTADTQTTRVVEDRQQALAVGSEIPAARLGQVNAPQ
jgi:beta-lactamase class A